MMIRVVRKFLYRWQKAAISGSLSTAWLVMMRLKYPSDVEVRREYVE
jgi:hypothetical protein